MQLLERELQALADAPGGRLLVSMPPRHGKSELVSVRFPVYWLERRPRDRVILGAYSHGLASNFSRRARAVASERMALSDEKSAAAEWETAWGGGVRAVGVGSGVTGFGADLLVIDDPIKSREEADSDAYREKLWQWWKDDISTRLEPGASAVVVATRWHHDDLIGRLVDREEGRWRVLNLPALAESDDPLGRAEGEALCPARYDREALLAIEERLGRSFGALYQGRPTPREGGMFRREDFVVSTHEPGGDGFDAVAVYVDKAATAGGTGAYSAIVTMARQGKGGPRWIVDVDRGRWSVARREARTRRAAEAAARKYGRNRVRVWVEQEPGSGGKESAEASKRNLAGFSVEADRVTGSKEARAEPFAEAVEIGNIVLLEAAWNAAYFDEAVEFPHSRYKDQIDASSGAFNKLAEAKESRIY